ncbi:NUDIX domain protein [Mycobacteroides abscessus MAB_030201_1061]|nr:NUDIX domain protein [Mycobacteroides abscessus MAB_030201_1061]
MVHTSTAHEVLAVVFQVRHFDQAQTPELAVLLWQRALDPHRGAWALPGGRVRADEDLPSSIRRQLAEKVDVRELAHLEQLAVFSEPRRVPGPRTIASTFLGWSPSPPHRPFPTTLSGIA